MRNIRTGILASFVLTGALMVGGTIGLAEVFGTGSPGNPARGVGLWAEYCDGCHNARDPKEFRDDQWRVTVAHMKVRIGLHGQDARDIRAFLQQANNPVSAAQEQVSIAALRPGDAQAGREVYNSTCIACHAATGVGLVAGVPSFTKADGRLAQSDDVLLRNIINGYQSPGSPMAMPPRGGDPDLTDQDLRNALSFIRTQFGG